MLTPEKGVFVFALGRKRIQAGKGFVDESGMTHDDTAVWQPIKKLLHQPAEIALSGKIIGAGEAGIECELGARGAAAKLYAETVEKQRLGCAEPPGQGLIASALANPGVGRGLFHRPQKRIAHHGK